MGKIYSCIETFWPFFSPSFSLKSKYFLLVRPKQSNTHIQLSVLSSLLPDTTLIDSKLISSIYNINGPVPNITTSHIFNYLLQRQSMQCHSINVSGNVKCEWVFFHLFGIKRAIIKALFFTYLYFWDAKHNVTVCLQYFLVW